MLPNISGIDMLKKIRNDKSLSDIPVIMLTAKNMESDKIEGLELGADDYITKPFSIKELLARVSSVLRRYNINKENVENILTVGSLNVNLLKHEVFKGNEKIDLTKATTNEVYYPGRLEQTYDLAELTLKLKLIFGTNRSALIETKIINKNIADIRISYIFLLFLLEKHIKNDIIIILK